MCVLCDKRKKRNKSTSTTVWETSQKDPTKTVCNARLAYVFTHTIGARFVIELLDKAVPCVFAEAVL